LYNQSFFERKKVFFTEELHGIAQTKLSTDHDDRYNVYIHHFIKYCLENGADREHHNNEGKTAFEQAKEQYELANENLCQEICTPSRAYVTEMIHYSFLERVRTTPPQIILRLFLKNTIFLPEIVTKIIELYIASWIDVFFAKKYVALSIRKGITCRGVDILNDKEFGVKNIISQYPREKCKTQAKKILLKQLCNKLFHTDPLSEKI
jgi:hypothetical protein